jgi:putative transposase
VTAALTALVPVVGVAPACSTLGVPRASYYRAQRPPVTTVRARRRSARALSAAQRREVLETLNSERFVDKPPRQIWAELLDDGIHLCSTRTMYRVLREAGQICDRRLQRNHGTYARPELVAKAPNEVWSWDITKVPGPRPGAYFSLYVALDIYSRYVVGWVISRAESKAVARAFLRDAFEREGIRPGQLVSHSDRGGPMTAKSTALLYADLGITASYSRPRVSNDNPYSESNFKTLKYRPASPERFRTLEEARVYFVELFDWYNERHYHTGIALLTPSDVHHGRAAAIVAARQSALDAAYERHPERFVRHPPRHPSPEPEVWINPPETALVR